MFAQLLALFIILPFVELYILLELSTRIGPLPTLGIVIITGIVGAYLAKYEGLSILRRIQSEMVYGRMPTDALFDGVLVLIGGVLLLTPGILTDITGFLLLLPGSRGLFKMYIKRWVKRKIESGQMQMTFQAQTRFEM